MPTDYNHDSIKAITVGGNLNDIKLIGNTITNQYDGIYVWSNSEATIKDNTINHCYSHAIEVLSTSQATVENNIACYSGVFDYGTDYDVVNTIYTDNGGNVGDDIFPADEIAASSCPPRGMGCTDTDNGLNYYNIGYARDDTEVIWDSCHSSSSTLDEAYCEGGVPTYESHYCENGCEPGRCIWIPGSEEGDTTTAEPDTYEIPLSEEPEPKELTVVQRIINFFIGLFS